MEICQRLPAVVLSVGRSDEAVLRKFRMKATLAFFVHSAASSQYPPTQEGREVDGMIGYAERSGEAFRRWELKEGCGLPVDGRMLGLDIAQLVAGLKGKR